MPDLIRTSTPILRLVLIGAYQQHSVAFTDLHGFASKVKTAGIAYSSTQGRLQSRFQEHLQRRTTRMILRWGDAMPATT